MQVSDLRGILEYIPRFRERTFVIAIDGEIIESENFSNLLLDLAVLRSLNIQVVIVHGASHQIKQRAEALGVTVSNTDGSGITDAETLRLSLEAANRLTHEIMEGLTSVDLRAVYANAIVAYPAGILHGVDQLYTGKVDRVDTKSLQLFLDQGIVPVLPPLGFDGDGKTYRINSDSVAVEVAEALHATKIIFLCEAGSLRLDGEMVRQLSIGEAEDLIKKGRLSDQKSLCSKLESAARACKLGVPRVHLLDGHVNEALLAELFSSEGIGTMVHTNEYQHIRRAMEKRCAPDHVVDSPIRAERGTDPPHAPRHPLAPGGLLGAGDRPHPGGLHRPAPVPREQHGRGWRVSTSTRTTRTAATVAS